MENNFKKKFIIAGLFLAEIILIFFIFLNFNPLVSGGVGGNVTVQTFLEVGEVAPEILNVTLNYGNPITLLPNSTKQVFCEVIVRDYNEDDNVSKVNATLYDSTFDSADDNNSHYSNSSCDLNLDFGSWNEVTDDQFLLLANCSFEVQYYANPGEWQCNSTVEDAVSLTDFDSDNETVNELLAVGLPPSINYGIVNSTYVSSEQIANVTNYGNVELDLALSGYAVTEGDGYSMNCTYGETQNISIDYEKFNLSEENTGSLSLSEFEAAYLNLTDAPSTKEFNLAYRTNDALNDALNATYWRIYVPTKVAGSCSGNIVFGAIKSV